MTAATTMTGATTSTGTANGAPSGRDVRVDRRAKIICTLGPASQSPETIRALVEAGMDVARLNFSHGTHDEHAALYARVREASDATGRAVGVVADLQGPKIRLGTFEGGAAVLAPGSMFTVTTKPGQGNSERASVSYEALARDLVPGDTLLLDDGMVRLCAISSDGTDIACQVVDGGPLSDHKGVNLPGATIRAGAPTEKDEDDLGFALRLGVDMVALSFVRSAGDYAAIRHSMEAVGRTVPVIAKIENKHRFMPVSEPSSVAKGLRIAWDRPAA